MDPRCPACKSRKITHREGLAACQVCGWVGVPVAIRRYPRIPHRKTGQRRT